MKNLVLALILSGCAVEVQPVGVAREKLETNCGWCFDHTSIPEPVRGPVYVPNAWNGPLGKNLASVALVSNLADAPRKGDYVAAIYGNSKGAWAYPANRDGWNARPVFWSRQDAVDWPWCDAEERRVYACGGAYSGFTARQCMDRILASPNPVIVPYGFTLAARVMLRVDCTSGVPDTWYHTMVTDRTNKTYQTKMYGEPYWGTLARCGTPESEPCL